LISAPVPEITPAIDAVPLVFTRVVPDKISPESVIVPVCVPAVNAVDSGIEILD
jgi:hypothetical protein